MSRSAADRCLSGSACVGSAEAAARARLFEAVARLGEALARRAPQILHLDDVQWADAATLDVILNAARRWAAAAAPVLIVGCVRSDDLATNPALIDWIAGLGRELPLTRIGRD